MILSLSVSTRIPGEAARTRKRENGTRTARNRTYRVEGGAEGDSGGGGGGARGGGERNTRDRQHSFVFSSARFGSTSYRISVFRGKPFFKFVATDLPLIRLLSPAGKERRSSGRGTSEKSRATEYRTEIVPVFETVCRSFFRSRQISRVVRSSQRRWRTRRWVTVSSEKPRLPPYACWWLEIVARVARLRDACATGIHDIVDSITISK